MHDILKAQLFSMGYFASDKTKSSPYAVLVSLASMFNIKITENAGLADRSMIEIASMELGISVPEPFYRGFPESVRKLTRDELLFDQMCHYISTYGFGNFDEAEHSLLEESIERLAFKENVEIREYAILSEEDAIKKLGAYVDAALAGTRPLNDRTYEVVKCYITEYDFKVARCACKDTAIRLLTDLRQVRYAKFIKLSDVIDLVDRINFQEYDNSNIRKLDLKNSDRKFISRVIDRLFVAGKYNIEDCFERKALWNGLLHHIHYRPVNEEAAEFVRLMRNRGNQSAYSEFEGYLAKGDVRAAAQCIVQRKGAGALLRRLNYILSRCESDEDAQFVLSKLKIKTPIIPIQILVQNARNDASNARVFKFTKHNMMKVHKETSDECGKRRSAISGELSEVVQAKLREVLFRVCKNKFGRVWVDEAMKNIALPLQETASMGGVGTLPKGSVIHIGEGRKIRAFTYWEKVNDIDLSVIGIDSEGNETEFSWRTMSGRQSDVLTFSGDETSGYNGGSEYFDIDVNAFRKIYPDIRYLVFCDNVFTSGVTFADCFCKAGYMLRERVDSGEIYEPKTVATSFVVNAKSRFEYLFGIDLERCDFVWLNTAMDSMTNIAGEASCVFLLDYFGLTDVINLYDLVTMMASEIVDDPADAELAVTDRKLDAGGAAILRSCELSKITALMNGETAPLFEDN